MNIVNLDGHALRSRDDLHNQLSELFSFPSYYGRNLDSLHDMLTDLDRETCLSIHGTEDAKSHLGLYWSHFLNVLKDAEADNSYLKLVLRP